MSLKRTPFTIGNFMSDIREDKNECKTKIYLTSFILNSSLIAGVFLGKNMLPPEVPLFYGLPEGEGQLVHWQFLGIPSIIAIVFTIINFLICKNSKNVLIKQISTYILIPINFFSLVAIIKIIVLVGNI